MALLKNENNLLWRTAQKILGCVSIMYLKIKNLRFIERGVHFRKICAVTVGRVCEKIEF